MLEPCLHETHNKPLNRDRTQKIIAGGAGDFNVNKAFNARNSRSQGRLKLEKCDGTCVVNLLTGPRGLTS